MTGETGDEHKTDSSGDTSDGVELAGEYTSPSLSPQVPGESSQVSTGVYTGALGVY